MAAVGKHCILEAYDCPSDFLNDAPFIEELLREAAKRAKATLLGMITHKFEPQGVTSLALLSESHISIHTWPEYGYAAIDAFTCGSSDPVAACHYMADTLQSGRHVLRTVDRGTEKPAVPGMPSIGVAPYTRSRMAIARPQSPD